MIKYTVSKSADGSYTAYRDGVPLGTRPKKEPAKRLCDQNAARELDWSRAKNGDYEATR